MKKTELVFVIIGLILATLFGTILVALMVHNIKISFVLDDYSDLRSDPKYQQAVSVDDATFIKQDVSCGYAVIEMFAKWSGDNDLTEKTLYDKYGSVVTSTGKSFEEEMNKQFPEYKTTMYKYLKNTELIDKVYDSLAAGIPVPFEWAAKNGNEWTLHYSLISGMDIANDQVTVQNPYGYEEKISLDEFINRTSFESYKLMPIFLKLGFAFGVFEKNTIFVVERR